MLKRLWIQVKNLPSQGRGYSATIPTVKYSPYLLSEIRLLSEQTLAEDERISIAKAGIQTNFPINSLYEADFKFILLLRTLSSVQTSSFKVKYFDGSELKEYLANLSEIEFSDVEVNLPISYKREDNSVIKLSLPTLQSTFEAESLGLSDGISPYLVVDSAEERESIYKSLIPAEAEDLIYVIKKYLTIRSFVTIKTETGVKEVDVSIDTITPFRVEERAVESRLSFGD